MVTDDLVEALINNKILGACLDVLEIETRDFRIEKIENNNLFFDHKIKPGKLETRNAIKILDLYKYPSEIIKEAKKIESSYFS